MTFAGGGISDSHIGYLMATSAKFGRRRKIRQSPVQFGSIGNAQASTHLAAGRGDIGRGLRLVSQIHQLTLLVQPSGCKMPVHGPTPRSRFMLHGGMCV